MVAGKKRAPAPASGLLAERKEAPPATDRRPVESPSAGKVFAKWLGKRDVSGSFFAGAFEHVVQSWPALRRLPIVDVPIKVASTGQEYVACLSRQGGKKPTEAYFGNSLGASCPARHVTHILFARISTLLRVLIVVVSL